MKQKLFCALSLFILSCKNVENDDFLGRFKEINEFPSGDFFLKKEILIKNDTISKFLLAKKFLMPINEITFSSNYNKNYYYYYSKYKLNHNFYLLGYKKFYDFNYSKIVISVYNKNLSKITNSIEINSSDPKIMRQSYFKNGIIYISNTYRQISNGLDPKIGNEFKTEEFIIEKYILNKDFEFQKIL